MRELLLLILLAASQANADNTGLSYMALCQSTWRCDNSLQAFQNADEIRVGWLGGPTFGSSCACARKLMQIRKPKVIRVHIANGPCLRNRRCGRYEIFTGSVRAADLAIRRRDSRVLKKFDHYLHRLKTLLQTSPSKVTCYVSPVLESDFSIPARRILLQRVASILPQCQPVDSVTYSQCVPEYICERHGPKPRLKSPCIADLDGSEVTPTQLKSYIRDTRDCALTFKWRPEFNCLSSGGLFKDPRKRNCGDLYE